MRELKVQRGLLREEGLWRVRDSPIQASMIEFNGSVTAASSGVYIGGADVQKRELLQRNSTTLGVRKEEMVEPIPNLEKMDWLETTLSGREF